MDEVYWADFEFDTAAGDWRTIRARVARCAGRARPARRAVHARGQRRGGVRRAAAGGGGGPRVDHEALPHALPVALAGLRALRAGRTVPPELAAPEYIRDKVAQTTAERLEARAAKDAQGEQGQHEEPVR